ncbi:MAG TPA: PVC-type heme-binding CxxCH protein, partial [Methylomirabilota bacterium]|nr:PVC-type heme-binding CxxCH protein [Methylomirabilota bacterium]
FTWGIDNRIHGALGGNPSTVTNVAISRVGRAVPSAPGAVVTPDGAARTPRPTNILVLRGRDFSFDPRTFDLRAESGGGQWGLSFDDEGNKFVCNNSRHIAVEMYEDRYARNRFYSMPASDVSIAADGPAAEVFRLSPDEPWRVIRTKWRVAGLVSGPVEGGGRASGYFTGAAGAMIYRGDAFPPEYRGDAFIADCGSNLIHRKKIRRDGLNFIAERAADEQRREFLASRDNWFRPVSFANAPDGTLYVVDMYRETIEHPWSIPPELKSKLDLNSGHSRGRIYRIVPTTFKQPEPVRLGAAGTDGLVRALEHLNGWHRDTAARLLCERRDTNAIPLLEKLSREATSGIARIHALYGLHSAQALTANHLRLASRDRNEVVRLHAIRLAASLQPALADVVRSGAADPDLRVRYAVALAENDSVLLTKLISRDLEEPWMRAAVLNGLSEGAADVFAVLAGKKEFGERQGAVEFLREAARIAGASAPMNRVSLGLRIATNSSSALTFASAFAAGLERRNLTLAALDSTLFSRLIQRARAITTNSDAAEPRRIEAAEFLGLGYDAESGAALVNLLSPSVSVPLQSAAVAALNKRRDNSVTNVVPHWTQLSPATRAKAVALFLTRRASALALVQAVEQGSVARTELSASDVERLRTHSDSAVREKAQAIFQRDASARGDVVKKFQPALGLKGDGERGRAIYQHRCAACHRAGTEGASVGPDLASTAANGKEKLLASILDPSMEVAAAYIAYSVETKQGESFVGVLAGENPLSVMLKIPSGETMRLGRESIAALRGSDKSLMPDGLEEGLDAQAMADLLEFVVQAKPAP